MHIADLLMVSLDGLVAGPAPSEEDVDAARQASFQKNVENNPMQSRNRCKSFQTAAKPKLIPTRRAKQSTVSWWEGGACSPDGALQQSRSSPRAPVPDFAALHPGYARSKS